MNTIIAINLATLEETALYLTKGWTRVLNNRRGKNYGGETHRKNTTMEDKATLEHQTEPIKSQIKQNRKMTLIQNLLYLDLLDTPI